MLQDFRAGDRAVLGDVTDDEDRRSGRFGVFEQRCRAFADLRNAPGRRFDDVGIDGLDRVDDHQVGPLLFDLGQNIFQQSFGIDQTPFVADAQTQGPHLDLLGRLFARNIEGFQAVVRQGDLQAEGRFADTRLAAEQHEGAGHEPSAQHAVHLPVSQVDAAVFAFVDVGDSLRTGFGQVGDSRRSAAAFTGDHLFGECVPFPAGGAASQPFGGFEAAVAAEECFLDLCHVVSFFQGVPMLPRRASAFLVIIPFPRRSESR